MTCRNRRRLFDGAHFPAECVQHNLRLRYAGLGGRRRHSECVQRDLRDWAVCLFLGRGVHLEGKDVQTPDCEGLHVLCFEAV